MKLMYYMKKMHPDRRKFLAERIRSILAMPINMPDNITDFDEACLLLGKITLRKHLLGKVIEQMHEATGLTFVSADELRNLSDLTNKQLNLSCQLCQAILYHKA